MEGTSFSLFSIQWLFSPFPSDACIRRLMTPCLTPAFLHSICLTKWSLARPAAPPEASHEKAYLLGLKRTWEKQNFELSNYNYDKRVLIDFLLTSKTTLSRWTKTQAKRCGGKVVGEGGGGGRLLTSFPRGYSTSRFKPLPCYKPFLQEKVITSTQLK